jgi:hypothetical protein
MKDYDSLKELFSDDIVLKDWDVHVTGKNKVMEVIKIMFDSAEKIKVYPVSFFVNSDYCYAIQVSIFIDTYPKIEVIDVISFNTAGKITEIVAFKYENISL